MAGRNLASPRPAWYRCDVLRLATKLVLAGAFLFALWTWVPIGGRTMDARWRAAAGPSDFTRRTLAELGSGDSGPSPGAQGRSAPRDRTQERRERVSDADRQALDRRLAEELQRDGARR